MNQISLMLRGKTDDGRIRVAIDLRTKSQLLIEMAEAIAAVALRSGGEENEDEHETEAADDAS